jgi:hypothetical protein
VADLQNKSSELSLRAKRTQSKVSLHNLHYANRAGARRPS